MFIRFLHFRQSISREFCTVPTMTHPGLKLVLISNFYGNYLSHRWFDSKLVDGDADIER